MHFTSASALAVSVAAALFSSVVGTGLPSNPTTDVCAEVDAVLKVPNLLLPKQTITIGKIGTSFTVQGKAYAR